MTITSLKRSLSPLLAVLILGVLCHSCHNDEIYHHYYELKAGEWKKYDTLYFDIDSTLFVEGVPYNIMIEVTNNVNYPYRNVWFFVQDNIDSDSVFDSTQKQYILADEYGKWFGSGFGSLYQSSFAYKEAVVFRQKRNYRIKLEHGMRDEPLSGIEKVGIKITRRQFE